MMRKILIGLAALALLAVGGFFAVATWATHRAEAEVETTFAALRATGANASHGRVSFDLMSRTLVVADIAVAQAGSPSASSVRVGRMTAVGVGQPGAGRLSADRIELADLVTESAVAALPGVTATYKAPRVEILGYSGPAAPIAVQQGSSVFDQMRASIERFATVTVSSMTIPRLAASVEPTTPGKTPQLAGAITVDYWGLVLRDLRDRHVAVIAIDKCDIALPGTAGNEQGSFKLEIARIAVSDMAFGAVLAAFDPAAANDDTYRRLYGQITTGTVKAALAKGAGFALDGVTVADVAFKPSKLRPEKLMAIAERSEED